MFRILLCVLMVGSCATTSWARPLDRIMAVVNNEVVLESELLELEATFRQKLAESGRADIPEAALRKEVLERAILQHLQLQRAQEMGVKVSDESVNQALRRVAKQNDLSLREFQEVLAQDGYDFTEFRESIRDEMIVGQLRKREVDDKILVSNREVDNFISTQAVQEGTATTSYHIFHILIAVAEDPTTEQLAAGQQKVDEVYRLLDEGGDFEKLAITHSSGENALNGGEVGWRQEADLPGLFVDVVSSLAENEVSEPIRSGAGFHLLKVTEKRTDSAHLVKQTLVSHILVKSDQGVSEAAAKSRLEKLQERILNGDDFAEIARAHSDDPGSAIEGGSLGWTSPGVMVAEFEEVMNIMSIGETSDVFKSRFGWHLLKVFDRREENMAEEFKRNQARQQIYQRKAAEELENWLRQMRDEAYVEYRNR